MKRRKFLNLLALAPIVGFFKPAIDLLPEPQLPYSAAREALISQWRYMEAECNGMIINTYFECIIKELDSTPIMQEVKFLSAPKSKD